MEEIWDGFGVDDANVGVFCVGLSGDGAKAGELPAVGVCGGWEVVCGGLELVVGFRSDVADEAPDLAGNLEYGPSCTVRSLGGLPRNFPVAGLTPPVHAAETVEPGRLRRTGGLEEEGFADRGAFSEAVGVNGRSLKEGVMAERG